MLSERGDFTLHLSPLIDTDVEKGTNGSGVIKETPATPYVLADFYLSNSALGNIHVYLTVFGDQFDTLIAEDIITDPIDTAHSYLGTIQALLEPQIWEWGGRYSIKASTAQKLFNSDLEGCKNVHQIYFNTGVHCFKYLFLIAAHKPLLRDISKTKLDKLVGNGGRKGTELPTVDFNCVNGQ